VKIACIQVSLLTGQKIQGLKINLSLYGNEIRELGNIGKSHLVKTASRGRLRIEYFDLVQPLYAILPTQILQG
jgi:hypothetical protein